MQNVREILNLHWFIFTNCFLGETSFKTKFKNVNKLNECIFIKYTST